MAIQLTDDHKPNRTDERRRIENAGGVVMWAGTWRVGGVLAMSRAFGNRLLKQFVVAEPEIQEQEVDEQLEYLVLASDGLWDVVKNEEAVTIVTSQNEPEAAAQKLIETALTRGSADNITCIVVRFHHNKDNSATAVPSPSPATSTDIPSSETSGQGPPPSLTDAGSDDAEGQPPSSPTDSYPSFADDNSGSSLAADTVGSSSTNNADVSSSATALVSPPGSVSVHSPPLAPAENFVPE